MKKCVLNSCGYLSYTLRYIKITMKIIKAGVDSDFLATYQFFFIIFRITFQQQTTALKSGSYNFKLNLRQYIEICEVVLYLYSHKPATDKEEPYTAILSTIFLLTLLLHLEIEKTFKPLTDCKLIIENRFQHALRQCETTPSPLVPNPVGIENCKQLFSSLLAFTAQKIATHSTNIISAVCVAFFGW